MLISIRQLADEKASISIHWAWWLARHNPLNCSRSVEPPFVCCVHGAEQISAVELVGGDHLQIFIRGTKSNHSFWERLRVLVCPLIVSITGGLHLLVVWIVSRSVRV